MKSERVRQSFLLFNTAVSGTIIPMGDLEVIIHKEAEGGYWAEIPAMPGCFSDGATLAEVRRNIAEAAQCWLGMEMRLVPWGRGC